MHLLVNKQDSFLDFFQDEPRNLLDHPYFVGKAWIPTIIILVVIFIYEKKTGKE